MTLHQREAYPGRSDFLRSEPSRARCRPHPSGERERYSESKAANGSRCTRGDCAICTDGTGLRRARRLWRRQYQREQILVSERSPTAQRQTQTNFQWPTPCWSAIARIKHRPLNRDSAIEIQLKARVVLKKRMHNCTQPHDPWAKSSFSIQKEILRQNRHQITRTIERFSKKKAQLGGP